jgi:hypothetical protein
MVALSELFAHAEYVTPAAWRTVFAGRAPLRQPAVTRCAAARTLRPTESVPDPAN